MKRILVSLLVVLLVSGLLLIKTNKKPEIANTTKQAEMLAISKQFGSVEISLEPKTLVAGEKMVFEMTAETHSVDLGFDWTKIVTLKDDLGSEYKAMDWTGESGGHHISGELIFEELKAESREVTLTVTGVDGVTESFSWII